MSGLHIENLSIAIEGKILFKNINASIAGKEVLAIMGPSGSGKSSLLSYIAGFLPNEFQGSGKLFLDDVGMNEMPFSERKVGLLFQDDLLFPHMNVGENLMFAMTEKTSAKVRVARATAALQSAGLEGFYDRRPATLSGGQKSRVSVLRTLLSNPRLVLLDEPFSKLDQSLRANFRDFVFSEIRKANIPCIIVTHDPADVPIGSEVIHLSH